MMNCECLWGNGSNYNDGNEEGSVEIGPVGVSPEPRLVEERAPCSSGLGQYRYTEMDGWNVLCNSPSRFFF